jgi:HIRAN domain
MTSDPLKIKFVAASKPEPAHTPADEAFESMLMKNIGASIDKHFYTSVVGTVHKNEWGSSRQEAIGESRMGVLLDLIREPDNPDDPNAVLVSVHGGDCVGYLKRTVAVEIARDVADHGRVWIGFVKEITGGTDDRPNYGMNIVLVRLTEEYVRTHPVKPHSDSKD